ncbi:MAG: hypothetical protein ACRD28_06250 [Acidobacteriaceae bacterium]
MSQRLFRGAVMIGHQIGNALDPGMPRDRDAKKLGYQPNLLARSLRNRKTHTIGILVPEMGEGHHTHVMSGLQLWCPRGQEWKPA